MTPLSRIATSLFLLTCATIAQAAEFDDYARVVNVTPQVERINQPRQECRTETVNVQRQQRNGDSGGIVGAIAGGILGNQVGGGSGKALATVAGTIAGAVIGDRIQNPENDVVVTEQPIRQCRTIDYWESRTVGYLVTYEYRGHTHTAAMPYDPGERLRLRVSVTPR